MLRSLAFVDLAKPFPQLVALPACFWQCTNPHSVQSQVPQEAGTPPPTDLLVESPKGAQGPRVDHEAELQQRKRSWQQGGAGLAPPQVLGPALQRSIPEGHLPALGHQ